jgi:hypothetical protein
MNSLVTAMPLFPNGFKDTTIEGFSPASTAANFSNFRPEFSVPGQRHETE